MSTRYLLALAALVAAPTASAQFTSVSSANHTIGLGYKTSCAIERSGTGVLCWGDNTYGQVGNGSTGGNVLAPTAVQGLPAGVRVLSIEAGFEHACALLANGAAMCWGRNQLGQLGDNTTTDRATAGYVWGFPGGAPNGATRLATGAYFGCVVREDKTPWCWGENTHGQIGDGTTTNRLTPYAVSGLTGVSEIAAGATSTFALLSSGAVMAWGNNQEGALGIGEPGGGRLTPVAIPALSSGVTRLSATTSRGGCAIQSGTLLCWGKNEYGRVGDGTTTNRNAPVPVQMSLPGGVTVREVATGYFHSCAELSNAAVQCWGLGRYLGYGSGTDSPVPVAMLAPPSGQAAEVAVGSGHTCVRTGSGQLYCTGSNANGQVGDGTTVTRLSPVLVGGQFVDVSPVDAPADGATLSPASPSPARGAARLTLTLPAAERVSARLLDVLGREVVTVFEGTAAAGETMLALDVTGHAPGVYRLVVAGERGLRLSRPVVVVR